MKKLLLLLLLTVFIFVSCENESEKDKHFIEFKDRNVVKIDRCLTVEPCRIDGKDTLFLYYNNCGHYGFYSTENYTRFFDTTLRYN